MKLRPFFARLLSAAFFFAALGAVLAPGGRASAGEPDAPAARREAARRPNILLIVADDLGYNDVSCNWTQNDRAQDSRIPTPNVDRIAESGVRFVQFFAAAPACTPSRACLLTGQYPARVGMSAVLMGSGGMSGNVVTVAETLKAAGYRTGAIGKWHLGYTGDMRPTRQGFEEFFGHLGGKIDYFKHTDTAQKGKHDLWEGEQEVQREGYSTNLFTDRAVEFVKKHSGEPFFLYLAYNAPHYAHADKDALQAPDEWIRKFAKGPKPTDREVYSAMVACMDDGIGRVLASLKEQKIDGDTLVIFMSDNGADPKYGGSNYPLSGHKRDVLEGGVRVPMAACWPGVIPAGKVSKEQVHMADFLPTALAAAGVQPPAGAKLDGANMLEVLKGAAPASELPRFFHYAGDTALRRGKWKLDRIKGAAKLFDLETDLQEKQDLSARERAVRDSMIKELDQYMVDLKLSKTKGKGKAQEDHEGE